MNFVIVSQFIGSSVHLLPILARYSQVIRHSGYDENIDERARFIARALYCGFAWVVVQ